LKTTSVGKKAVKSFRRESLFERGGRMESFLSKKEVAEILGVSMSTVNRLISDGMLKMVRISRKRIGISEKDLQEYIDSRKKQSNNLSEDGGRIVYQGTWMNKKSKRYLWNRLCCSLKKTIEMSPKVNSPKC